MRHLTLPLTLIAILGVANSCASGSEDKLFALEHTQLDPAIIRIYATGDNGTSVRNAVQQALTEARKLCKQKGYTHFYIIDNQTVYRRNRLTRQPSYVSRGYAETRGTTITGSRELQGGAIDIDYHDNHSTTNRRQTTRSGTVVSTNDKHLQQFSSKTDVNKQSWAAVTVQFLHSAGTDVGKHVYSISEQ